MPFNLPPRLTIDPQLACDSWLGWRPEKQLAHELITGLSDHRVQLLAPDGFEYQVADALNQAVQRDLADIGPLSEFISRRLIEDVQTLVDALQTSGYLKLEPCRELLRLAFCIATSENISVATSLSAVLAHVRRVPLLVSNPERVQQLAVLDYWLPALEILSITESRRP